MESREYGSWRKLTLLTLAAIFVIIVIPGYLNSLRIF